MDSELRPQHPHHGAGTAECVQDCRREEKALILVGVLLQQSGDQAVHLLEGHHGHRRALPIVEDPHALHHQRGVAEGPGAHQGGGGAVEGGSDPVRGARARHVLRVQQRARGSGQFLGVSQQGASE